MKYQGGEISREFLHAGIDFLIVLIRTGKSKTAVSTIGCKSHINVKSSSLGTHAEYIQKYTEDCEEIAI